MNPSFSGSPLVQALVSHYDRAVLPLWTSEGWNGAIGLPYEALDGSSAQPLPVQRYRAMACARQLYVFSMAASGGAHADVLFAALQRWFADPQGGWFYSVDADGVPLDRSKDLYTHAFVVFACAAYLNRSGNPAARAAMEATVAVIEERFARDAGLPVATMMENFSAPQGGVQLLQNPVMHLTEAYLAAYAVDGDSRFAARLDAMADAVVDVFVDPLNGCIAELPVGSAGNRFEPGHQFEWFSLARMSSTLFAGSRLGGTLDRAFDFARRYGVDDGSQGVVAAVDMNGVTLDPTQRIWAQTEYARALALRGTPASVADLLVWLRQFPTRFLHARGWHECLANDGSVLRAEMPSTTPYHLATSYQALEAFPQAG